MAAKKKQTAKTQDFISVQAAIDQLNEAFPEREAIVETLIDGLLAEEHVLLVGPPGTAKSALVKQFSKLIGEDMFHVLLTKFTEPGEVFGPLSLKAFEDDRLARKTEGYAPEAGVWFLDEVFKGSSALLNANLTAINERKLWDDEQWKDLPLKMAIGASNELPHASDGLNAFMDRFLIRHMVGGINQNRTFDKVIWGGEPTVKGKIDPTEVEALKTKAKKVKVAAEQQTLLRQIRTVLGKQGISPSDRRWKKAASLARARAARAGRLKLESGDFEVLKHVLWSDPAEIEKVHKIIDKHVNVFDQKYRVIQKALREQLNAAASLVSNTGKDKQKIGGKIVEINSKLDEIEKSQVEPLLKAFPANKSKISKLTDQADRAREHLKGYLKHLGLA